MKRIVFSLMLLPIAGSAQAPVDARELLLHADDALFKAASFHLAGTITMEMATAPGFHQQAEFSLYGQGGKARRELSSAGGKTLDIFDGVVRSMVSERPKVSLQSPGTDYSPVEMTALAYGRDSEKLLKASLAMEETLGSKQVSCYVVRAVYRGSPLSFPVKEAERRVWISRDNRLVLRDIWEYPASTAGHPSVLVTQTINYALIEWNQPIAENAFVLKRPAGGESPGAFPLPAANTCFTCFDYGNPFRSTDPRSAASLPGSSIPGSALLVTQPKPDYSPEARAAGLQGSALVFFRVDSEGKPTAIQLLHGLGMGLDEKAVRAVQQWRFQPADTAGKPVSLGQASDIVFHLDGAGPWRMRRTDYRVVRKSGPVEVYSAPVLSSYVRPDAAACPADGSSILMRFRITEKGMALIESPASASNASTAVAEAVRSWRYYPGTANGRPRAANADVEMDCGSLAAAPLSLYHVGDGVTSPFPEYKPEPEYSEEARRMKLHGDVTLSLVVDGSGHVQNLQVIKSLGFGLDEKAMEAVSTWRFKPAMKDGHPVAVQAAVSINFRLL